MNPSDSPGTKTVWIVRDLVWLTAGLYIGGKIVAPLIVFPDTVIRAQSVVLVAAAAAAAFLLPRRGVLLPSTHPLSPEAAAAFANAKCKLPRLLIPLILGYLAIQLPSRFPILLILIFFWGWLASWSLPLLTRAETAYLCLAATVLAFDAPVDDPWTAYTLAALAALAAVIYFGLRSLERRFGQRFVQLRVWAVRTLAGVLVASGGYQIVLGLVGEIIVVPLAFLLALAVGIVARRRAREQAMRKVSLLRRPIALGSATFVAWILIIMWGGWVDHELSAAGFGTRGWGRAPPPYPSTSATNPQELVEDYQPFFVFAKGERWRPSHPLDYLRSGRVLTEKTAIDGDAFPERGSGTSCVEPEKPLCVVTIKCPAPEMSCAEEQESPRRVVFARIIEHPLEREGFDRSRAKRPLKDLTRLIQYWAFYRYDDWRRWPLDGWHQWHEGDWESVAVGLSDSGPILAAYSAHCGGNWRRWERVAALAGTRDATGLHPLPDLDRGHHALAFVGKGTHAAYPDDRERAPNWATCARFVPALAEAITWGPAHSINVREVMPSGGNAAEVLLGPPVVLAAERKPAFMRLRAYWGPANHMRMFWSGGECPPQHLEKKCGRVAETPPLKDDWRRPIWTIFCDPYWHPRGYCPPRKPPAMR